MTAAHPFDDFRALVAALPAGDEVPRHACAPCSSACSKPPARSAGWRTSRRGSRPGAAAPPAVTRPLVAIFAGNHGVTRNGISKRRPEETAAMVELCAAGGAAVNQICIAHDLGLKVFDLALDLPTADITEEAALDERACAATMAFGMEAVAGGSRPAVHRRHRRRQLDGRRGDAGGAVRRQRRGLGRAAVPARTSRDPRRKVAAVDAALALHRAAAEAIRWRCCAGSAGASSRRSPAPSSPPACRARAGHPRRLGRDRRGRRAACACSPARSTIACSPVWRIRRAARRAAALERLGLEPLARASGCRTARARARRWQRGSSRPPLVAFGHGGGAAIAAEKA